MPDAASHHAQRVAKFMVRLFKSKFDPIVVARRRCVDAATMTATADGGEGWISSVLKFLALATGRDRWTQLCRNAVAADRSLRHLDDAEVEHRVVASIRAEFSTNQANWMNPPVDFPRTIKAVADAVEDAKLRCKGNASMWTFVTSSATRLAWKMTDVSLHRGLYEASYCELCDVRHRSNGFESFMFCTAAYAVAARNKLLAGVHCRRIPKPLAVLAVVSPLAVTYDTIMALIKPRRPLEEYDEYGEVIPDDGSDDYDFLDITVPRPVFDPTATPSWSVRVPRFTAEFRNIQSDFRLLEPVLDLFIRTQYEQSMDLPLPPDSDRRAVEKVTKDTATRLAEMQQLHCQFDDGLFRRSA